MKHSKHRSGFSLVELVIVVVIIGIIGAIAIPRMSRAARNAGSSALKADLTTLRNAIELYAAEHNGNVPGANIAQQLTQYSNITGTSFSQTKDLTNDVVYGPYLKEIPALPVGSKKGERGVHIATTAVDVAPGGTATDGWFYNTATLEFRANLPSTETDDDDVAYNTY